jgi:hypothetical protein
MPRTRPPRLAALAVLSLAAWLVIGCGSGSSAGDVSVPPTLAVTPTPAPPIVSPAELKSYRYTIMLTVAGGVLGDAAGAATATGSPSATGTPAASPFTIDIAGEVVNPDRERSETRASLGFIQLSVERIEVAGSAWTRESGGEWKRATAGSTSSMALGTNVDISPARLFAEGGATFSTLNEQLGGLASTADSVNGIAARRYDLTATEFRTLFSGAEGLLPGDTQPVETTGSLWIGDDSKVPVRIRLNSTTPDGQPAFQMDMELSDLNAPIEIAPPA